MNQFDEIISKITIFAHNMVLELLLFILSPGKTLH